MSSRITDKHIEDFLLSSDSSDNEGDDSESNIVERKLDHNHRRISSSQDDNSDKFSISRKRKASIDLFCDKPTKRSRELPVTPPRKRKAPSSPASTPPSSPVRKVTPRKSPSLTSYLEKHSAKKKDGLFNQLSTYERLLNGTSKKSPAKNKLNLNKSFLSQSPKTNIWVVTNSPSKNQISACSSPQNSSNESPTQVSDTENKDRNNTQKITLSPTVRRIKPRESVVSVLNSPDNGQAMPTKNVSVILFDLKNSLLEKMHPNAPLVQERPNLKVRHLEENNGSPRRSVQKPHENVSTSVNIGINSPDKTKTSSKEQIMSVRGDADGTTKLDICTPERKTDLGNQNDRKQLLSPKLNSGNTCAAASPKVLTPLQKREITVTTPVSNKRKGRTLLTPGMPEKRETGECTAGEGEDTMDATRRQLHVSTVPQTLPCREHEFDCVRSFLAKKIGHGAGGCMYISGVPGTGKTATVHAVIRHLQEEVDKKELPDFDFVEINGLRLTEPRQAYVRILQSLTDQKRTPDQAQQMLDKRFSRKCRKPTVILVDELDYLCNRRQDVVYNVLEWGSSGGGGGVVVVAVSNTMDLPERALKGRVTSRMGLTRLAFRPYTHKQLQTIVTERLADHPDAFHPDAIQFIARKVAAVSGDARRALDICRRTTELVQPSEQVTAAHVERALAQIFSGARVQVIRRLGQLAQMTLRALRDAVHRTGVEETTVAHAHRQLTSICQLEGMEVPSPGATLAACVSLAGLGLIVAEKRGRPDLLRKICLNVSSDDIHYALDNAGL